MRYFLVGFALIVILVLSLAGFRGSLSRKPPLEVFPDMDRQLKLRPQEPNAFFTSGISSQLPVTGTVARAQSLRIGEAQVFPYQDHPAITGMQPGTTNFVELNPMPITRDLLERGRERYQISCYPCHGALGDGKGIVSRYGWLSVANFHDPRIVALADGDIYHTITYGKNTMGAYGDRIGVTDRWAIVAYVRALQTSQLGTVEDVPESQRAALTSE